MRQRNDKSSPFQLADRQLGLFEINKIIAFDSIDSATHANQWTADTGSKGRTIWPVDFYWYGNAQLMHIHSTMCGYQSLSNEWPPLLLVLAAPRLLVRPLNQRVPHCNGRALPYRHIIYIIRSSVRLQPLCVPTQR